MKTTLGRMALALAAVAALGACDDGDGDPRAADARAEAGADTGSLDGARADVMPADAMPPDVTTPDTMPPDAMGPDAIRPDAMPPDAAPTDMMASDAAQSDAMPPDAGPPFEGEGVCDPETVIALQPIDMRLGSTVDAPAGAEPSCSMGGGAPERVFTWVAPDARPVCVSLAGADFDTVLHVRRSPCNDPAAEVACNDDAGDLGLGVQSALSFVPEAGARYFAFVDGYAGGEAPASGAYDLQLGLGPCRDGGRLRCVDDGECPTGLVCDGAACVGCVEDEDCPMGERCMASACQRGPLPGAGACAPDRLVAVDGWAVVEGENAGAPLEDVGSCNAGTLGPEVAHAFTAPADGPVCARTLGSPIDTVVYVRRTCGEPASELACNDDVEDGELTSAVAFDAIAGETYAVFVDAFDLGDEGEYVLAIVPGPCAAVVSCDADDACPDGSACRVGTCVPM